MSYYYYYGFVDSFGATVLKKWYHVCVFMTMMSKERERERERERVSEREKKKKKKKKKKKNVNKKNLRNDVTIITG